ncbi:hypothetical protein O181_044079 [Austropuccinia psidii MF-1]|uniref:Integrase catalytic domain-containing protein n=1 Tax=Austropuccinia psidii MF-1 TaxID=1389203 RepID=A0A9Q3DJB5_9BASI|nr:hypothetical protein [Austropuccinia psidii MF-1]
MLIQIQEPKFPCETAHMNWVTDLPPGGERSLNAFLVLADSLFETNLSFSTAYHPQNDGLAERMIQNLEEMVRRFCAYGPEFKDSDGFTYDWYTLISALELE